MPIIAQNHTNSVHQFLFSITKNVRLLTQYFPVLGIIENCQDLVSNLIFQIFLKILRRYCKFSQIWESEKANLSCKFGMIAPHLTL